jgi:hypothetical protein
MSSQRTDADGADLLGRRLVGAATETVSAVMEELAKSYGITFKDIDTAPQFVIEVVVFYMHLVDRLAFAYLGAARRGTFADRFTEAVLHAMLAGLRSTPPEALGRALLDTYNRRQIQYARYKVLIPKEKEPLKDTLYWEFSKVLFGFLDDENPATIMFLNIFMIHYATFVLNDEIKVDEVLRTQIE